MMGAALLAIIGGILYGQRDHGFRVVGLEVEAEVEVEGEAVVVGVGGEVEEVDVEVDGVGTNWDGPSGAGLTPRSSKGGSLTSLQGPVHHFSRSLYISHIPFPRFCPSRTYFRSASGAGGSIDRSSNWLQAPT